MTIKNFNPTVHFLSSLPKDNFGQAKNGAEEEEYLRSVCVQKYYPQKFWDYLICRAQNIQSAYWEDCLGGLDAQNVRTCARSAEGLALLEKNTSLVKQLQITSGPSYLLDNCEVFASQAVPSNEEFKKILKQ